MNINTKSWHYKLYAWTYYTWGSYPSIATNLCEYTQRLFWVSLLTFLFRGFMLAMFVAFMPVMFVFGMRPIDPRNGWMDRPFGPFVGYRGLFGWLYPWMVLGVAGFVLIEARIFNMHRVGSIWFHSILTALVALIAVLWFVFGSKSESMRLFRAWAGAKKDRICPLVSFSDSPTEDK